MGAASAEVICAARDELSGLDAFRMHQPWWMPYPIFHYLAEQQARAGLEPAIREQFPEAAELLEGMAEGAGVSAESLFLYQALEAASTAEGGASTDGAAAACTAVASRRSDGAGGGPRLVHNFDNIPILSPFFVVRERQPKDGLRFLEFSLAPLCGTLDGLNEAGLAITYNYAWATDLGAAAPPVSMAIWEALTRCRSSEEAARLICSKSRSGGAILLLNDELGEVIRLELSPTRAGLIRAGDKQDLLFASNRYHSARMQEVEIAADGVFSDRAPPPLRGRSVMESPQVRDARLNDLLAPGCRIDDGSLSRVMSDHGRKGRPSGNTVCMHGTYWTTLASVRLLPKERRMQVAYDAPCRARYVDFAL